MEKLIDVLQARILYHESMIKLFKTYGNQFYDDIKISEGQIMECKEIMRIILNMV